MITLSKSISKSVGKENKVSLSKLLSYIHLYHEIMSEEFPECIQDHPHMELCADGSGAIVSLRQRMYNQKIPENERKYKHGILISFTCLNNFVGKTEALMKKHRVKWTI